jgi:RNA polymerase sigma-70 factor (ECF subfamily)
MMSAMDQPGHGALHGGSHAVETKDGFLAFYRVAIAPAYRSANRLCGGDRVRSEDLVQEAFMDLVREIRSGHITSVDVGWIIVAIRHRFIDSMRRREREERRLRLVWSRDQADAAIDPAQLSSQRVTELLARLPEAQRAAVVLHHVDGLSVSQVAAVLDRSPHATESLLARGRDQLRRLLTETSDDE